MDNDIARIIDEDGKPIAEITEQTAWKLINNGRVKLISKNPMVVQVIDSQDEGDKRC